MAKYHPMKRDIYAKLLSWKSSPRRKPLISHFPQKLYYWRSKGGRAEFDFLCQFTDQIFPLEVKAGYQPKGQKLEVF
jgi:predicted AAA+ superfamily ATPase